MKKWLILLLLAAPAVCQSQFPYVENGAGYYLQQSYVTGAFPIWTNILGEPHTYRVSVSLLSLAAGNEWDVTVMWKGNYQDLESSTPCRLAGRTASCTIMLDLYDQESIKLNVQPVGTITRAYDLRAMVERMDADYPH